jgi:hypothetical protein
MTPLIGALLLVGSLVLVGLRSGAPAGSAAPAGPAHGLRRQAAELRQLEAAELATLRAQRKAAASPREALALQQHIEQRKRQTELALLRAQALAARASEATALADAIGVQIQQAERAWKLPAHQATQLSSTDQP